MTVRFHQVLLQILRTLHMITEALILIVEDDLQFKKLLEIRLKSFITNLVIEHRTSIQGATTYLQEHANENIDLVILDQHLPDGKGLDLLTNGSLEGRSVLSMSSDDNPEIPGANLREGAAFFLSKTQISQPLVKPLIYAIIERGRFAKTINDMKVQLAVTQTVNTLVDTLRHEINNPLGAVLGGAFLLKNIAHATPQHQEAAELIEQSGKRIKHVLEQIIEAANSKPIEKATTKVFHIPGDAEWE